MKRLWLLLTIWLWAAPVRAGDAANLELIGFSSDGAYLAFEQFWVGDGNGFPYSDMNIVDVKKNALVWGHLTALENENAALGTARARSRTGASAALRRYGIKAGIQGKFIGLAPAYNGFQSGSFEAFGRTHTLEIGTNTATLGQCPADNPPLLLELRLLIGQTQRVLQRDTRLPASRTCAYGYEMRSAHLYGRSLAVFLTVTSPGFEGPDRYWMVVTARI